MFSLKFIIFLILLTVFPLIEAHHVIEAHGILNNMPKDDEGDDV